MSRPFLHPSKSILTIQKRYFHCVLSILLFVRSVVLKKSVCLPVWSYHPDVRLASKVYEA